MPLPDSQEPRILTLAGVACAVLREDKTRLDEKQYIMYEVISCSFLLGLLDLHDHRGDESPLLLELLGGAIGVRWDEFERAIRSIVLVLNCFSIQGQIFSFVEC